MKKQRGITLISLVITIVVLIILAGVAINLSIGENGLFNKAKYAVEQQKMAETKEKIELAVTDIYTDKISKGEECTIDTIISELSGKINGLTIVKDGDKAKGEYNGCDFTIDSNLKTIIDGYEPAKEEEDDQQKIPAGLYDANDVMLCTWEESGIDIDGSGSGLRAYEIIENNYPTATKIVLPENVKTIGAYAFLLCETIKSFILPNSLTYIGEYAFEDCEELVSIVIPNNVNDIDRGVFFDCDKLESISLPDSLEKINAAAFACCYSLTNIDLPDTVTYIGESAFDESGLISIKIPDGVTYIGKYAFYGLDDSLESITWKGITYTDRTTFNNALKTAGVATEDVWVNNSDV